MGPLGNGGEIFPVCVWVKHGLQDSLLSVQAVDSWRGCLWHVYFILSCWNRILVCSVWSDCVLSSPCWQWIFQRNFFQAGESNILPERGWWLCDVLKWNTSLTEDFHQEGCGSAHQGKSILLFQLCSKMHSNAIFAVLTALRGGLILGQLLPPGRFYRIVASVFWPAVYVEQLQNSSGEGFLKENVFRRKRIGWPICSVELIWLDLILFCLTFFYLNKFRKCLIFEVAWNSHSSKHLNVFVLRFRLYLPQQLRSILPRR